MRSVILIHAIITYLTVTQAKLSYRGNEDLQYAISSSSDGSKSGFYGAQRGNMDGNYEKGHNMDTLAQHQASDLIGQLADDSKEEMDSIEKSANIQGLYKSGKYDFSNSQSRNFKKDTTYEDSLSPSFLKPTDSAYNQYSFGRHNVDYYNRHSSPRHDGQYKFVNSNPLQYKNLQTVNNLNTEKQLEYDDKENNKYASSLTSHYTDQIRHNTRNNMNYQKVYDSAQKKYHKDFVLGSSIVSEKPKSHQYSFSYHKSLGNHAYPYVVNSALKQNSLDFMPDKFKDSPYDQDNFFLNKYDNSREGYRNHDRQKRSYFDDGEQQAYYAGWENWQNENFQNPWNEMQSEQKSGRLEDFNEHLGQAQVSPWDNINLGQQQNNWGQDFQQEIAHQNELVQSNIYGNMQSFDNNKHLSNLQDKIDKTIQGLINDKLMTSSEKGPRREINLDEKGMSATHILHSGSHDTGNLHQESSDLVEPENLEQQSESQWAGFDDNMHSMQEYLSHSSQHQTAYNGGQFQESKFIDLPETVQSTENLKLLRSREGKIENHENKDNILVENNKNTQNNHQHAKEINREKENFENKYDNMLYIPTTSHPYIQNLWDKLENIENLSVKSDDTSSLQTQKQWDLHGKLESQTNWKLGEFKTNKVQHGRFSYEGNSNYHTSDLHLDNTNKNDETNPKPSMNNKQLSNINLEHTSDKGRGDIEPDNLQLETATIKHEIPVASSSDSNMQNQYQSSLHNFGVMSLSQQNSWSEGNQLPEKENKLIFSIQNKTEQQMTATEQIADFDRNSQDHKFKTNGEFPKINNYVYDLNNKEKYLDSNQELFSLHNNMQQKQLLDKNVENLLQELERHSHVSQKNLEENKIESEKDYTNSNFRHVNQDTDMKENSLTWGDIVQQSEKLLTKLKNEKDLQQNNIEESMNINIQDLRPQSHNPRTQSTWIGNQEILAPIDNLKDISRFDISNKILHNNVENISTGQKDESQYSSAQRNQLILNSNFKDLSHSSDNALNENNEKILKSSVENKQPNSIFYPIEQNEMQQSQIEWGENYKDDGQFNEISRDTIQKNIMDSQNMIEQEISNNYFQYPSPNGMQESYKPLKPSDFNQQSQDQNQENDMQQHSLWDGSSENLVQQSETKWEFDNSHKQIDNQQLQNFDSSMQATNLKEMSQGKIMSSSIENSTEKIGFWKSVGNKLSNAKNKMTSWFEE